MTHAVTLFCAIVGFGILAGCCPKNNTNAKDPVKKKTVHHVTAHKPKVHKPSWLSRSITFQANRIPFNLLMTRLLRNSRHILAQYDETIKPQRLVSLHYTGTLEGALNTLAAETHYHYRTHAHTLYWSAATKSIKTTKVTTDVYHHS